MNSEGGQTFARLRELIWKNKDAKFNLPKFKWQSSFHDHVIRNKKDFENHYKYVVYNYLKHGLSPDYKYTSLNFDELIDYGF